MIVEVPEEPSATTDATTEDDVCEPRCGKCYWTLLGSTEVARGTCIACRNKAEDSVYEALSDQDAADLECEADETMAAEEADEGFESEVPQYDDETLAVLEATAVESDRRRAKLNERHVRQLIWSDAATEAELKGLLIGKLMSYATSGVLEPEAVEELKELRLARDKAKPGPRSSDERRVVHADLCMKVAMGTVARTTITPLGKWALEF